MSGTTVVMAYNKSRMHTARHDAGGAPMPAPTAAPVSQEHGREFLIEAWKRDHPGKPLPKYLSGNAAGENTAVFSARQQPPGQPATLRGVLDTLLGLREATDRIAATKGMHFVDTDEPTVEDGPHYALPTSWEATNEAGPDQDGRAHGDAGIELRRREVQLTRELADARKRVQGAGAAGKAAASAKIASLEHELAELAREKIKRLGESTGLGPGRPI